MPRFFFDLRLDGDGLEQDDVVDLPRFRGEVRAWDQSI